MTYPFSDDRMVWNEDLKRYYLTPYAMQERGYDISARVTDLGVQNPTQAVNGFFMNVTDHIYNYIHSFNVANDLQDHYIGSIPSLRPIIYRALIAQAIYMYANGDLSLSTDAKDEGKEISPVSKRELLYTVPELGRCIIYAGRF